MSVQAVCCQSRGPRLRSGVGLTTILHDSIRNLSERPIWRIEPQHLVALETLLQSRDQRVRSRV